MKQRLWFAMVLIAAAWTMAANAALAAPQQLDCVLTDTKGQTRIGTPAGCRHLRRRRQDADGQRQAIGATASPKSL